MRRPFKKQFSDRHDKFAFSLASLGGVIAIISIRVFGSEIHRISIFDIVAIVVAIGIITLYAIYILMTTNRSSLSLDRGSDNVYYLGLLFTLASLAYSLIKLSQILHDPVFNVDGTEVRTSGFVINLLPDFGLALFSTIAGIWWRIILQQMRDDPKDVESQAREQLGDAIRHLRDNIGYVLANLNGLSEQTKLSLTELNQVVARTLEQSGSQAAKAIENVTSEISGLSSKIQEQTDAITSFTNNTNSQFQTVIDNLHNQLVKALEQSGNQTSEAVGNVTSEIDMFSSKVREQTAEITNFTNNMTSQFQEIIDKIHTQFAGLVDISGIAKDVERVNEALSKIGSHADALENTSKVIEGHGKRIKSAAQGVEEASDEYVEELSKTAEVLRSKTR